MTLDDALRDIRESFGQGSILDLKARPQKVDVISTGSLALDLALGVGGVPRGRVVEIYGPESSGKTTLALHILAEAQRQGLVCAFVDAEHALDTAYSAKVGVDCGALLIAQPDSGEEALEIVVKLVESGEVGAIVVDSVAALTPRAELEGEIGQQMVGMQSRMMAKAMRKLAGPAHRTNTLVVFINQLREKVGVVFGSPETQPGGRALKFTATQRIDIRRIETVRQGSEAVANRVRCKVVKNKLASPYKTAEFEIAFGQGIVSDVLDAAVQLKLVTKDKAFYAFPDGQKVYGRPKAVEAARALEKDVREAACAAA